MTAEKKKAKEKFSYFKVNEKILDTDIKKSELWVYLTHCRSRGVKSIGRKVRGNEIGEKKEIIYSIARLTRVKGFFGSKMNERAYKKAIKSLEEKELINVVDIEKTGINRKWYPTKKAIEIIEPKDTVNIQIPYQMLDNKIMADMTVEEIKTIIELYRNYDYSSEGLGAVSIDCIVAKDTNTEKGYKYLNVIFGSGFNRSIYNKEALAVTDFNYIETELDINIIEKLVDKKLFNFKPVIIETDLEDDTLFKLKYELFKDTVHFADEYNIDYVIAELMEDEGIVWVLEPTYRVNIKPTKEYLDNYSRAYSRAVLLYTKRDSLTDREHRRYALYHDRTYEEVEELVDYNIFEQIIALKEELGNITGNFAMIIDCKEIHLKNLYEQHTKEKEFIADENERLKVEEGYRSRVEVTPRLKALDKEIKELEKELENVKPVINELEKKLLKLIPIGAMEYFFFESGSYEFENVGRATRLIG